MIHRISFVLILLQVYGAGGSAKCISTQLNGTYVPGRCVEILRCPVLLDFAKSPGKSRNDFKHLRSLTCAFIKEHPWVCCPENDIYEPPQRDEYNLPLQFPDDNVTPVEASRTLDDDYDISNLIPKLEDCGEPRVDVTSSRIIGGSNVLPGEMPFMALLYRIDTDTDEEEYFCSGTIINQFYILTAAHCILTNRNATLKLAYVQVGITDVAQRCQRSYQRECLHERRYEVNSTVVHPSYTYGSRDKSNDIALIRTVLPMEIDSKFIRPVCLPLPEYGLGGFSEEYYGVVAGWGTEQNMDTHKRSTSLKATFLRLLSHQECQLKYAGQVRISKSQFCAGGEYGRDTCIGDSGGPLLVPLNGSGGLTGKLFQVGVISFGPSRCGVTGNPSVYTSVASYVDWILDNMHL